MTLEEIRVSDKPVLVPADVAPVLHCRPYAINVQAQTDPKKLGFPVCITGRRVKIPRIPFLNFIERGNMSECAIADKL